MEIIVEKCAMANVENARAKLKRVTDECPGAGLVYGVEVARSYSIQEANAAVTPNASTYAALDRKCTHM